MRPALRLSLLSTAVLACAVWAFAPPAPEPDADSLHRQALQYQQGDANTPVDRTQAISLFTRAAEQGHAASHHQLARHYSGLSGARFDPALALQHYHQAAVAGYLPAQLELAFVYFNGRGQSIPKDLSTAFVWFEQAAQQGDTTAQCMLGDFYQQGLGGVNIDHTKALQLYRSTAEQDSACATRSQFALYQSYLAGVGVEADLPSAIGWLERAAVGGNPQAQRRLGEHYRNGEGVPKNPMLAYNWQRKSREGVAPHDDHDHHTLDQFDFPGRANQQRMRFASPSPGNGLTAPQSP